MGRDLTTLRPPNLDAKWAGGRKVHSDQGVRPEAKVTIVTEWVGLEWKQRRIRNPWRKAHLATPSEPQKSHKNFPENFEDPKGYPFENFEISNATLKFFCGQMGVATPDFPCRYESS